MAKVLIVIPCHNEAESIAQVIKSIFELQLNHAVEILVINDASTDRTAAIAKEAGASVVDLPVNLGIGGAVQTGFRYAKNMNFDIAVQVDGDGQHPVADLDKVIGPVADGSADLVIGSRYVDGRLKGNVSSIQRVLGSQVLTAVMQILTGKKILDLTSGFRAAGRSAISVFAEDYPYDFPEPISAMLGVVRGFVIREVPVSMIKRKHGSSSITSLKSALYMIKVTCLMCLRRIYG